MRILFITAHRLGDAVLSTAALSALIHRYPEARFTIVCGPDVTGLFAYVPCCERVIPLHKKSYNRHWFSLWGTCIRHSWFMVVDLRSSLVSLGLRTGKRVIVRGGRRAGHKLMQHQQALCFLEGFYPRLWLGTEDKDKALILLPALQRYVALAPTAGSESKIWPPEAFAALASRFLEEGYCPVLFYGPGKREENLVAPLRSLLPQGVCDLGGEHSLGLVAALLQRCTLFVGNDSGLMHLSAAASVPTLGLFGPSRIAEYGPVGRYVQAMAAPGQEGHGVMSLLDSEKVFRAACLLRDGKKEKAHAL